MQLRGDVQPVVDVNCAIVSSPEGLVFPKTVWRNLAERVLYLFLSRCMLHPSHDGLFMQCKASNMIKLYFRRAVWENPAPGQQYGRILLFSMRYIMPDASTSPPEASLIACSVGVEV